MKIKLLIKPFLLTLFLTITAVGYTQEKFGGMTFYTIREELKENPKEVIKEVADMGYKYIEATGYKDGMLYGMTPVEFKAYLDEVGLEPISSHQGGVTLENVDKMIADLKTAGFKYFVIPVPPMGHFKYDAEKNAMSMSEDLDELVAIFKTIGEKCNDAGLKLLYHNHNFEFSPNSKGIVPLDYFLENVGPDLMNFQLDLYWITKGGADPLAYFEKYPGRFKIWHVKDMDEQGRFAPVGKGTIDFGKILAKKEQSGMEYYIVEQDKTFDGMKPMEAVKISREGLKKFGFN
ncbi:MAG: sugar phosphate isomerase [Flavobacteriales bacterium]|nr:MAG: sugar phosphate isomerase [Flavobacteriales bacterium]